jgi:mRNA-degrading endonuclease RelE of RelBE toxin-antitoxin system
LRPWRISRLSNWTKIFSSASVTVCENSNANPFDPRISKPVTMSKDRRTSRVGNWRIIYYVDEAGRTVFVAAICHRKEAYDKF